MRRRARRLSVLLTNGAAYRSAKPFRDAEERDRVRESLASIGFGNVQVDQKLTNDAPESSS